MAEMEKSKELKPKSFRITDETAEKFKEIAVSLGGSQQDTLNKLIEAFELQTAKNVIKDKQGEIERFEKHISIIVNSYLHSLEENQTLTDTVRTEFSRQLDSKDSTIADLQERLKVSTEAEKEAKQEAGALRAENERLNEYIEKIEHEHACRLENMEDVLKDKDELNTALKANLQELRSKFEKLSGAEKEITRLKDTLLRLEKELAESRRSLERSEVEREKALLELERKHQEEMAKLYVDLMKQKEQKSNSSIPDKGEAGSIPTEDPKQEEQPKPKRKYTRRKKQEEKTEQSEQ